MPGDDTISTRTQGASAEGVRDQYADGKAARVWQIFVGDKKSRTENYKKFLVGLLRAQGCKRVLDVACGTGIDSILLLEEGFEVVSVDASDKMLKHALSERWTRRREPAFDNWVIEEANWLTLYDDIAEHVKGGFDAVICLGNSFAHMQDEYGDQREQRQALANFEKCVKPGGLLLIDHRNYDNILDSGSTPSKSLYYNSSHETKIETSVLYKRGKPAMVMLDYFITVDEDDVCEFRLSYYPHQLEVFKRMLVDIFQLKTAHQIYGDFKSLEEVKTPAFYIHVVEKKK